jgi:ribosomal protein S18 acetylase RimI-like enzyme
VHIATLSLLITSLSPSTPVDFPRYREISEEVASVLLRSFGDSAYPAELHDRRLTTEQQRLFVARFSNTMESIIGCSYVRLDGKRGATGVLPEFRGIGVGLALVLESLRELPAQYAEVKVSNSRQIHILSQCGFAI